MIRRPPRSTRVRSSAASDVYKRQLRAALWQVKGDKVRATDAAVRAGRTLGWIVVGLATLYTLTSFEPLTLLWIVLGWYLLRSAEGAGRRERLLAQVGGLVAGDV